MNTVRLAFFLFLLTLTPILANAQKTVYYQSVNQDIQKAKELFRSNNYVSALNLFGRVADDSGENSEVRAEAMYYKALCAIRLGNENAESELSGFLTQFPESQFRNRALFEQAVCRFDAKKYTSVLKTLEDIDRHDLSDADLAHYYYMRGYSYFEGEKYGPALTDFAEVKDGSSMYAAPARYYFGHINYLQANYESALQEFLKLTDNPSFKSAMPFYISQIYYMQGNYGKLVDYVLPIINKVLAVQQPELSRLLGSSYFYLRDFANAVQFLEFYLSDKGNKGREENYMLGYCYYLGGREAEAIPLLETASKGKDALAQNAYYHLADCYIATNDKNKARQAFEAASEFGFDPKITEDALFNYAKITYELSYSPFNETIKAFDKYISLYPDSERNDAAYEYLVKVYMGTNNFREAMASIEKIKVRNLAVKKAYQRVAHFRALECFTNLDYVGAVENFAKSIEAGGANRKYQSLSYFWQAEAYFRLSNFGKSVSGYHSFLKSAGAESLDEYKTAHYNLGYAYFEMKDYSSARDYFRKYIDLARAMQGDKIADAYNRLGDCNFLARDYPQAIANYGQALQSGGYDADYSLYQKSFCMGLLRDGQGKINNLNLLLKTYPNSAYCDDALFELGRAYERAGQPQMAMIQYQELVSKYPQGNLSDKALVQMGLIAYNANDFEKSVGYYKQVTARSSNSQEAKAALAGMKNSYVEMNDVDSYFSYSNSLGTGAGVSVNEQDSLSYQAAEKLFMANDKKAKAQLERYLAQFPRGTFAANAHFYLAQVLYGEGRFDEALAGFEQVIARPDNSFTGAALLKAAGLHYNNGDYSRALGYFDRLAKAPDSGNSLPDALTGIMRCQFNLANYQACIEAANQLLDLGKTPDIVKRETNYKMGLSYYRTNNPDKALPIFVKLAVETNSAEGAESKFMVSKILFEKQKFKESEKEIMDFIDKNSPHQFWLAKSFLLLADIYLKNGDEFQAKHTLKSVEENYPDKDDGIINETRLKLQQIEAGEAKQVKNQGKPLEINISGGKK